MSLRAIPQRELPMTRRWVGGYTRIGVNIKIVGVVVVLALVVAINTLPGYAVKEEVAVHALETNGFTNVVIKERAVAFVSLRGGSKQDAARFTAEANNPRGDRVTVYVFSGWLFKGATIRSL
ncbi:MAG: hypothetical protein WEC84_03850 [Candidatus Andersenbacteria bacterium]